MSMNKEQDHRPCGYYQVFADEPDHKVKQIVVHPDRHLSLQRHRRRAEHTCVARLMPLHIVVDSKMPLPLPLLIPSPSAVQISQQAPFENHKGTVNMSI